MAGGLCYGCFSAPRASGTCAACGYREGRRSPLVLPPGTTLSLGGQYSQYIVGRVLGKPGGFGITYLGWHSGLEQRVAIKEFLPRDWAGREPGALTVAPHSEEDDELFRYGLEQFLQEARTLGRINHPNVVRVRDFFEQHGTAYLVMDYYEGMSLSEYLATRGGKLAEAEAVPLMLFILDGLREVHRNGFLHRDIKPQNIYLRKNGQPILLDFGAARQAFGDRSRSMSVVLTEGFAPFEQYHRAGRQGPWTDIYACGATLYYLLTGEIPPEATERMERDTLGLDGRKAKGISAGVAAALERALALRAEERPQTVEEFQALLGAEGVVPAAAPVVAPVAAGVEPAAAPDGAGAMSSSGAGGWIETQTGPPVRRRRLFQAISWSSVVLFLGVGGKFGWQVWKDRQYDALINQPWNLSDYPSAPPPATGGDGLVGLDRSAVGGAGTNATGGTRTDTQGQREYAAQIAQAMGQVDCEPNRLEIGTRHIFFRAGPDANGLIWAAAKSRADQVYAKLQQGEDFAALVQQYSDDPLSRDVGGHFGYVRRGQQVPEFEEVVFSLANGEYSAPIRTRFGYHIVKVDDRRCGS